MEGLRGRRGRVLAGRNVIHQRRSHAFQLPVLGGQRAQDLPCRPHGGLVLGHERVAEGCHGLWGMALQEL